MKWFQCQPSEQQLQKWAKTLALGRKQYILLYGVLGWGVPTGLIWALILAWRDGWDKLPGFMIGGLIGFPIGGILFGALMWKWSEAAYQKSLAKRT